MSLRFPFVTLNSLTAPSPDQKFSMPYIAWMRFGCMFRRSCTPTSRLLEPVNSKAITTRWRRSRQALRDCTWNIASIVSMSTLCAMLTSRHRLCILTMAGLGLLGSPGHRCVGSGSRLEGGCTVVERCRKTIVVDNPTRPHVQQLFVLQRVLSKKCNAPNVNARTDHPAPRTQL